MRKTYLLLATGLLVAMILTGCSSGRNDLPGNSASPNVSGTPSMTPSMMPSPSHTQENDAFEGGGAGGVEKPGEGDSTNRDDGVLDDVGDAIGDAADDIGDAARRGGRAIERSVRN